MMIFKHILRDKAGQGEGGGSGGEGDNTVELPSWDSVKGALPEEIRDADAFKAITSIEGLAKSYVHAQKSIGKDKITIPDQHATEEDYQQIFRKLGVPESLEDYKMGLPEGVEKDDEFVKNFTEASHKAGILPHQAEKVFGWYRDYTQDILETHEAKMSAKLAEDETYLRTQWGQAYEDNIEKASIALKELVPDEDERKELVDSGLANNRSIMKLLANASKYMDEDTIVKSGGAKFSALSPEEALQKARNIQGDMSHPYRNPSHPNHLAAQKEVANLYKIAYPE